jgi:hypothetical protein
MLNLTQEKRRPKESSIESSLKYFIEAFEKNNFTRGE